jgi:hypothetical protein
MSTLGQRVYDAASQPEDFANVVEFAKWYAACGMPMVVPVGAEVYRTDDALSICVFRAGRYQAQLYAITDLSQVPEHAHPVLDLVFISLGDKSPANTTAAWLSSWLVKDAINAPLKSGDSHGGGSNIPDGKEGNVFLVCTKWPKLEKPHTASAVWKGKTLGPKHTALIKRFFPHAYERDGYVDITRTEQT